ncbi:glycosyltransferase family 2 protein [Aquibaculum sediminis]|uniref:glycosyltransferase family 2 protein n=1 Tax=Aquibaculum sediminis TaxID=3231907 RepID=UPI003452660D
MTEAGEPSGVPYDGIVVSDVLSLEAASLKAHVDAAVQTEDGALVVAGWIYDPEGNVKGFAALPKLGELLEKGCTARHFPTDAVDADGVQWLPVERPDVTAAHGDADQSHRHGFVLIAPRFPSDHQVALLLDDRRYALLPCDVVTAQLEVEDALEQCISSAGPLLYAGLQGALGDTHELTRTVGDLLIQDVQQVRQLASCDEALLIDGKVLLLNGWIGSKAREIKRVRLVAEGQSTNLTRQLSRYPRPDLREAFPRASDEALGYIVATPHSSQTLEQIELRVVWHNGERESSRVAVTRIGWPELYGYLQRQPNLFPSSMHQLGRACRHPRQDAVFATRLSKLRETVFPFVSRTLPTKVEHPERSIVAIDRVFALGEAGMLIYGWKLAPHHEPLDITAHDEWGKQVSVKRSFLSLVREDVASAYRERFPSVPRRCGFILHVPLATEAGDARAICFHYAERGDLWLRLPVDQRDTQGIPLIKEMLGMIPHPEQLNHYLYEMFDGGLGAALEAVNQQRLAEAAPVEDTLDSRQFGEPPEAPTTSVIVPLYGRCDFMRHQLAHFADDPDFQQCDLIYVVDDPALVEQTLSLAARYQWLFNVPFRVVWYGRNLGFAGANNAGASVARGERLLLLNSDVIPQQAGWLSTLETALETLTDAGAVGPLLQFGDGSIQHAGMQPRRDPQLPGFLLNSHPGMGQRWEGPNDSYEQPLLTAACLMLRKADYEALGGLDEGYVIGDFEDSDLCLGLRSHGLRLYVVPEARLWHLERQSQTLNSVAGVRQLITLFNGWRYQQKIARGERVDPMTVRVGREAAA